MKNKIGYTLFLLICASFAFAQNNSFKYKLLIGTYTNAGNSEGIYYYQFNKDGSASFINKQKATEPSRKVE